MLELTRRLGMEDGRHFLHDFGSEFTVDLEWEDDGVADLEDPSVWLFYV